MKRTLPILKRTGRKRSYIGELVAALAVAAVGTYLLVHGHAATPSAAAEAESGVFGGAVVNCPGSQASGSTSVTFGVSNCVQGRSYTNPVKLSTADPGAMAWGGKFYVVSTSGNPSFNIYESDDMVNWQWANAAVFDGTHPWGVDRFWAPELHRVNNKFYVYYSAGDANGKLRIGVATADAITGPYKDYGRPIVTDGDSDVIDINFFHDDDGRQYLYWKRDKTSQIMAQEVAADGVTLVGSPQVMAQPSLDWEQNSMEGPWVMKKDGQYYMFYSGSVFYADTYGIGVARAASPLGPWVKKGDPILRSGDRWKGPGHNSVVSIGNDDFMFYHAWDKVVNQGDRIGLVDKINWSGGWPSVAGGMPSETLQPYPY